MNRQVKKIVLGLGIFTSPIFSEEKNEPINFKDLCKRFRLEVEVYFFNESGTQIKNVMPSKRVYKVAPNENEEKKSEACQLRSNWSSTSSLFSGLLYMSHLWKINQDGSMDVTIEQFKGETKNHDGLDSLGKENYAIKNMTPIIWESRHHKNEKVIIRYTPSIAISTGPIDMEKVPIAGDDIIISDHLGRVWSNHLSLSGMNIALTTLHGTLILSYYPFKGSNLIGVVSEDTMYLRVNQDLRVEFKNSSNFLPVGSQGNVYGIYLPDIKSDRLSSTSISESNDPKEVLERLKLK